MLQARLSQSERTFSRRIQMDVGLRRKVLPVRAQEPPGVAVPVHRVGIEDPAGTRESAGIPARWTSGSRRCSSTAFVKITSKQSSGYRGGLDRAREDVEAELRPRKVAGRGAQLHSLAFHPIWRATSNVAPALQPISSRLPVRRYRENRHSLQSIAPPLVADLGGVPVQSLREHLFVVLLQVPGHGGREDQPATGTLPIGAVLEPDQLHAARAATGGALRGHRRLGLA